MVRSLPKPHVYGTSKPLHLTRVVRDCENEVEAGTKKFCHTPRIEKGLVKVSVSVAGEHKHSQGHPHGSRNKGGALGLPFLSNFFYLCVLWWCTVSVFCKEGQRAYGLGQGSFPIFTSFIYVAARSNFLMLSYRQECLGDLICEFSSDMFVCVLGIFSFFFL